MDKVGSKFVVLSLRDHHQRLCGVTPTRQQLRVPLVAAGGVHANQVVCAMDAISASAVVWNHCLLIDCPLRFVLQGRRWNDAGDLLVSRGDMMFLTKVDPRTLKPKKMM